MLGNQKKVTVTGICKKAAVLKCNKLQIIILKFVNNLHFDIKWRDCKFIF